MSMLAEPKNKHKYSINPRGLDWVNDESKFGQKLMEKMGWSKGQGLGAKKDGNTDHIHVSVKIDKKGVGCSTKAAEEWLDHQDGFSNILDQLNAEHVDPTSRSCSSGSGEILLSLEHKSKNSSSRVHYQKFTKSKDLSVKNSKDLDCIFGNKARKEKHSKHQYTIMQPLKDNDSDFGVKTSTSSLSSLEYFASKLHKLKQPKSVTDNSAKVEILDSNTSQKYVNKDYAELIKDMPKRIKVKKSKIDHSVTSEIVKNNNSLTNDQNLADDEVLETTKSKTSVNRFEVLKCSNKYSSSTADYVSIEDDSTYKNQVYKTGDFSIHNRDTNSRSMNTVRKFKTKKTLREINIGDLSNSSLETKDKINDLSSALISQKMESSVDNYCDPKLDELPTRSLKKKRKHKKLMNEITKDPSINNSLDDIKSKGKDKKKSKHL